MCYARAALRVVLDGKQRGAWGCHGGQGGGHEEAHRVCLLRSGASAGGVGKGCDMSAETAWHFTALPPSQRHLSHGQVQGPTTKRSRFGPGVQNWAQAASCLHAAQRGCVLRSCRCVTGVYMYGVYCRVARSVHMMFVQCSPDLACVSCISW
jgi:hypothetical protein